LAICVVCTLPAAGSEKSYDLVVVGAGAGGVAASIQAARQGVRVALVEETDWIGGQMTAAAVSTMDEAWKLNGPQGIYDEFKQRIGKYYADKGKSIGTCYYQNISHCYEPSVAQKILYDMIGDVNRGSNGHVLDVFLRQRVVEVLSSGKTVTGVVTQDGIRFDAKVVIDATEFGDVLPLSPAAYRSGNNLSSRPAHRTCTQDITYVAVIKKYLDGVPADLVMHDPPPGYDGAFLSSIARVLRQDGNPASRALPVSFTGFKAYRAIPDSSNPKNYDSSEAADVTKTSLDWFNDYPVTTDIFDRNKRKAIVCAAKLKTLDLLYYLQHDMKESAWSVANDEGFDTPYNREENLCPSIPKEYKAIERNFPVIPYIRESQRVVGKYTLTSLDIQREDNPATAVKQFASAIALGDYKVDLHGCWQEEDMEQELEHAGDLVEDRGADGGPFQVPEESLIPLDVDGLLVAEKNLSQSRFANGATRLQPITMLTGQAAGALAAIAIEENKQPREVPVEDVQRALLLANSSLTLESLTDSPGNSEIWRAAQFTRVHGWLTPKSDASFGYTDTLTRGEVAQALARTFSPSGDQKKWYAAFGHSAIILPEEVVDASAQKIAIYDEFVAWRKNQKLEQAYKDVPIYSEFGLPTAELAQLGVMTRYAGQSDYFFPNAFATEADLIEGIQKLAEHNSGVRIDMNSEFFKEHDRAVPLSKASAASILYWYGTHQKDSGVRQ
jgi:hypothetical protein